MCDTLNLDNPHPKHTEVNVLSHKYPLGEISRRGKEIYQKKIKHLVEPQKAGKFVVIDVESGDYEVDDQHIAASTRLRERRPNAVTYAGRVGYQAAYSLGGRLQTTNPPT